MFRRLFTIAAAVLPVMAVSAAELPEIQEGLWEIHSQGIENPGNKKTDFTHKLCRDHAYDKAALAMVKNMKGCTSSHRESRRRQVFRRQPLHDQWHGLGVEGHSYLPEHHLDALGNTHDLRARLCRQN